MKELRILKPGVCTVYITDKTEDASAIYDTVFKSAKNVAIITDNNVFEIYGRYFDDKIKNKNLYYYAIPAGEQNKNAENYLKIIEFLSANRFTRRDCIVAFGGGVVGDIAGFVASTYMRGIDCVSVPTTVLSMVDSSVGGKTAIDFGGTKNLIGTFYSPKCVIIKVSFYATLPVREIKSGFGEIIKYAFLNHEITADRIRSGFDAELVYDCLSIKKRIVESDAFESGDRKLLNLGHTFGHAIEELSDFTLSHGECVVKGLYLTLKASQKLNDIADRTVEKAVALLKCKGHDVETELSVEDIEKALYKDKKYDGENLSFVALDKDLTPYITKITVKELVSLLK